MKPLDEIWARLCDIRALNFESESRTGIGWSGAGEGIVKVAFLAPDAMVFEESGEWTQNGGKQIRFTNCFRWSRAEDRLRLEHLRFGAANPVFLFEMAPDENSVWRDVNPHACRDDCYSATLEIGQNRLLVNWSVSGPKRDETIRYIYF